MSEDISNMLRQTDPRDIDFGHITIDLMIALCCPARKISVGFHRLRSVPAPWSDLDFGNYGDKANIMKRLAGLGLLLAAVGCTAPEPALADREACIGAGHRPGTEAFEACLQELLARRLERPAGDTVDDLRTRMGPP